MAQEISRGSHRSKGGGKCGDGAVGSGATQSSIFSFLSAYQGSFGSGRVEPEGAGDVGASCPATTAEDGAAGAAEDEAAGAAEDEGRGAAAGRLAGGAGVEAVLAVMPGGGRSGTQAEEAAASSATRKGRWGDNPEKVAAARGEAHRGGQNAQLSSETS